MNRSTEEIIKWMIILLVLEIIALYNLQKAALMNDRNYLYKTMFLYGVPITLVLYKILEFSSIGIVNFSWNVLSTISVLMIGIYFFHEKVKPIQMIGIAIGLFGLALVLL